MNGIPKLDVIQTKVLPRICPSCAHKELTSDGLRPVVRLACPRCAWFARYQLREVTNA